MDVLLAFVPLLLFGGLLIFLFRKSGRSQKDIIETNKNAVKSNDRLTESNYKMVEAVNRLADVIEKK